MSRRTTKPSRIASRILEFIIQKDIRYGAMGDLDEQFYWILQEQGSFKARLRYWKQIGGTLPYFIKNVIIWSSIMFRNYLRTTFRNITRHIAHSALGQGRAEL
jgi:hypothetical protein